MSFGSLQSWKAYLVWSTLFLLVFLAVYLPCNWITAQRHTTLALHLPWELRVPFVPGFIGAYLSLALLWPLQPIFLPSRSIRHLNGQLMLATAASGLCFLLLPARLGFVRTVPSDPLLACLFNGLFAMDRPHNLVPSLHVANSTLIVLAFCAHTRSPWARLLWALWLLAIAASTLLVHQHHLLDVATGLGLGALLHRRLPFKPSPDSA